MTPRDGRRVLFLGILGLLGVGLVVRTGTGLPPSAGRRINEAIVLDGQGEKQLAYEKLQSVVVARPDEPDAWMRTGIALTRLGRSFDAAVYLSKAYDLAPESRIVRIEYVKGLLAIDLPGEAQVVLQAGLDRDPDDGGYLYLASSLAAARGDGAAAAELFRRAVENHAYQPDRFRYDPHFDPVRNDLRFLEVVQETRVPASFNGS
jgi:tetratricopeptide (TPR) repeat protein